MNNKTRFLMAYRMFIEDMHKDGWGSDRDKVSRYLSSVEQTISGRYNVWMPGGDAYTETCKFLGFDVALPLKALRIWIGKG
jgi:hypothetical protein